MIKTLKTRLKRIALDVVSSALHYTSIDDMWARRKSGTGGATVLMYHSVTDHENEAWIFPDGSIDVGLFEKHMRFLSERRSAVSLSELVSMVRDGVEPAIGTVAVTFDDGYLDTLRLAGPILQKYGIPATVFVVSDWIGKEAPWIDRLHSAINRRSIESLTVESKTLKIGTKTEAEQTFGYLCKRMMGTPGNERDQLLNDILAQLQPDMSPPKMLMDWDDIGRWLDQGSMFEVGVHTRTHTDLTLLSDEEIHSEITHCRNELEERYGISRPHFAYPYGRSNKRTELVLRTSGCQSGFATEPMERVHIESDIFALTRVDAACNLGRLGFVTSGVYPELSLALLGRQ